MLSEAVLGKAGYVEVESVATQSIALRHNCTKEYALWFCWSAPRLCNQTAKTQRPLRYDHEQTNVLSASCRQTAHCCGCLSSAWAGCAYLQHFCTAGHMRPSFLMVTTYSRVCSKPNCRDVKTQISVRMQNQRAGGILPLRQHTVSVVWARAPYQKPGWWNTPSTRPVPNQRTGTFGIRGWVSSPIAQGSGRIWSSKVGLGPNPCLGLAMAQAEPHPPRIGSIGGLFFIATAGKMHPVVMQHALARAHWF